MGNPIAVLGGGSWGTALAHLLAHAGHDVTLLLRDAAQAAHINAHHENPRYLRGVPLHPGIRAVAGSMGGPEQAAALEGGGILVLSVPCQALRAALRGLAGAVPSDCVLVNTAKGIEVSELVTAESMVRDELPGYLSRYAVLSGPSFALEVASCKPTAVVLGCRDERLGARLREVFSAPWFRAYSSSDVPGVELGGAIKNVIAIAAGLSDGLGFGLNARAALVTRGLAETSRLGVALGARASTFMGLSGLGDLMLTCSGDLSRNRQVGLRLGAGETLDAIAASMNMVAEGVKTTQAVYRLAQRLGVDMPVTAAMHGVLYGNVPPREAVQALMSRQLKEE
ncbi:MAG: NAD(P)H-dependent glycerol-3-phosphate dehydrogenase [Bilophila sp.]